jgi:hypothetical protein
MAQIDDGALKNLQEIVKEISRRANRLNNWLELEAMLSRMARKFDDINNLAVTAAGPPVFWNPDTKGLISLHLRNLKRWDFADFVMTAKLFSGADPANNETDPSRRVADWVITLSSQLKEVDGQVAQDAPPALKVACQNFQDAMENCLFERKRVMLEEVRVLSELTRQVQDRLSPV